MSLNPKDSKKDKINDLQLEIDLPDKEFFRIGEVSDLTGIKPHVLRYWETEFPVLSPAKSESQQRNYSKADVELVLFLKKLLYEEGYTIAGAREKLKSVRNFTQELLRSATEKDFSTLEDMDVHELKALLITVRRELSLLQNFLQSQSKPSSGLLEGNA